MNNIVILKYVKICFVMKSKTTLIYKNYVQIMLFLVLPLASTFAQITINPPTIVANPMCASPTFNQFNISFSFTPVSGLLPTNQFILEISDASGNFSATPTVLVTTGQGQVTSSPYTFSNVALPTTTGGSGYTFRVKSTAPAATSGPSTPRTAYYKSQDEPFSINNLVSPVSICSGGSYVLSIDNPGTGSNNSPLQYPALTYKWFKEPSLTPIATTNTLTVSQAGVYYVETNYGTCTSDSYSNRVTVNVSTQQSQINASLNVTNPSLLLPSQTKIITVTTDAASPTFEWYLDDKVIPGETSSSYTASVTGNYKVIVTQTSGCVVSKELLFVLQNAVAVNIPNIVSPNNDGINDFWIIPNEYINSGDTEVMILNARGEIVLNTNDYQNNWPQETIEFKSLNPLFYYIIAKQGQEVKKGSITVLK